MVTTLLLPSRGVGTNEYTREAWPTEMKHGTRQHREGGLHFQNGRPGIDFRFSGGK